MTLDQYLANETNLGLDAITAIRNQVHSRLNVQISESYIPELNEKGWQELGKDGDKVNGYTRQQMNDLAWKMFYHDPMVSHACNLHASYVFGNGAQLLSNDPSGKMQDLIDSFLSSPGNSSILARSNAQHKLMRQRLLDGEIYFLFFVSKVTGSVEVRVGNPREFKQTITMQGDESRPESYERCYKQRTFDYVKEEWVEGDEIKVYLPDFRVAKFDHSKYQAKMGLDANTLIYVYHVLSNDFNKRGLTHFSTAIPWLKAYKGTLEDQIMLSIARSTFAFEAKIKGDKRAVDRALEQFSDYSALDGRFGDGLKERRTGGNTLFSNENFEYTPIANPQDASNFYQESRVLKQQVGIGLGGIFEHYFGDPSTGNLATATAMELPMLKVFEAEQQFWRDVLTDVLWFVQLSAFLYNTKYKKLAKLEENKTLNTYIVSPKSEANDFSVSVRFPEIITRDASLLLNAIAMIKGAEAATGETILPNKETMITALELIGFEDALAIWERVEEEMSVKQENEPEPEEPAPTEPPDPQESTDPEYQGLEESKRPTKNKKKISQVEGEPLPEDDALSFPPLTDSEIEEELDTWLGLPELEELRDITKELKADNRAKKEGD